MTVMMKTPARIAGLVACILASLRLGGRFPRVAGRVMRLPLLRISSLRPSPSILRCVARTVPPLRETLHQHRTAIRLRGDVRKRRQGRCNTVPTLHLSYLTDSTAHTRPASLARRCGRCLATLWRGLTSSSGCLTLLAPSFVVAIFLATDIAGTQCARHDREATNDRERLTPTVVPIQDKHVDLLLI